MVGSMTLASRQTYNPAPEWLSTEAPFKIVDLSETHTTAACLGHKGEYMYWNWFGRKERKRREKLPVLYVDADISETQLVACCLLDEFDLG